MLQIAVTLQYERRVHAHLRPRRHVAERSHASGDKVSARFQLRRNVPRLESPVQRVAARRPERHALAVYVKLTSLISAAWITNFSGVSPRSNVLPYRNSADRVPDLWFERTKPPPIDSAAAVPRQADQRRTMPWERAVPPLQSPLPQ